MEATAPGVCKGMLTHFADQHGPAVASQDVSDSCTDAPLKAAIATGHVTFVHLDRSQTAAAAAPAAAETGAEQQVQGEARQQQRLQNGESGGGAATGAAGGAATGAGAPHGAGPRSVGFGSGIDELELEDDE